MSLPAETAVLAIDIQVDFCPGGALAVGEGDQVVAPVNRLLERAGVAVLTQDWHPANHRSFAANHPGAAPFSMTEMPYGPQVLWPTHCVIGTDGAAFHADLAVDRADLIIRKGFRPEIDSYSAFFENDRTTQTGLTGYLRERGVETVICVGLALDFCVFYSAMDAVRQGFQAVVLEDCCRAIDLDGSLAAARTAMAEAGVTVSTSGTL
ncbi:MAG: bifunctional nicotinamidase/pyrazinamidase [Pseudomonadota bacterium]